MELDDLKKTWMDHDRKLDASLRLNRRAAAGVALGKAESALGRLTKLLWAELALDALALLWIGSFLFDHRLSNLVFGVLVVGGSAAAFLAPPFTGLDTLPALGVVLLSLAVLLEDIAIVVVALVVGICGVALEILLGAALIDAVSGLL